jgi:TP901-1 family phage major tail protein
MAERGQDYILEISSTGTAFTKVGKLTSLSLSRERDTTETNNFDSPDWAESISAMRSWSIDSDALYVYTDAGQAILEAAYASNDPHYFLITSAAGTVGTFEFQGQGYITEASLEFETNEVVAYSISVEGTGPLTRTAIAGGGGGG